MALVDAEAVRVTPLVDRVRHDGHTQQEWAAEDRAMAAKVAYLKRMQGVEKGSAVLYWHPSAGILCNSKLTWTPVLVGIIKEVVAKEDGGQPSIELFVYRAKHLHDTWHPWNTDIAQWPHPPTTAAHTVIITASDLVLTQVVGKRGQPPHGVSLGANEKLTKECLKALKEVPYDAEHPVVKWQDAECSKGIVGMAKACWEGVTLQVKSGSRNLVGQVVCHWASERVTSADGRTESRDGSGQGGTS
eukprot:jgi/Mesvir1/21703/Mv04122-RA.1